MKRKLIVLFLLFALLLLFASSALAQDASSTEEPAATLEVVPSQEVEPTSEPTQEVIIIVTQTPENSPTPTLTPTPEMTATAVAGTGNGGDGSTGETETGSSVFANVGWVAFLFTLSALAFVLVTWIRELRKSAADGDQNSKNLLTFVTATQNMLPVDGFLALLDQVEKRAKATPIPGEIDDKIAAQVKAAVYEALGRELPPEFPPNTTSTAG